MERKQIIDYIVNSVKSTQTAFASKELPYDPQIIKSATLKELKKIDSTVDTSVFDAAIEEMKQEGFIDGRANGLIFFKDKILS
jgi:hypothetical protein